MVQEYIHNVVDFMHILLCLVNVFENIFYIFSIPLYGFHIMHIGVTIMMFTCIRILILQIRANKRKCEGHM
jgi:hypothetical protein